MSKIFTQQEIEDLGFKLIGTHELQMRSENWRQLSFSFNALDFGGLILDYVRCPGNDLADEEDYSNSFRFSDNTISARYVLFDLAGINSVEDLQKVLLMTKAYYRALNSLK